MTEQHAIKDLLAEMNPPAEKMVFAHCGDALDSCYNSDRLYRAYLSEADFLAAQEGIWERSGHTENLIRCTYKVMLSRVGRAKAIDICNAAKPEQERNRYRLFVHAYDYKALEYKTVDCGVFECYKDADLIGGRDTCSQEDEYYYIEATQDAVTRVFNHETLRVEFI